ncbi:3-hydroxyacyl-CoA dehydrogenase [Marinococcus halotolerans]|uniref:3-hydroxyacyl-CoA dehydrogenase n=1 Tax=Marinococcus halotolerans TaxID=301092 RepID=UPI0003B776FD|nr:3-hydroxyacyl-CoA dehydrogenase [Marinococcus halotolerans]
MDINGKVFLLPGGASGLGGATANMLVENGAKVVIADFEVRPGRKRAKELGDSAIFIEMDVTSDEKGKETIDKTIETFGRIDGVVNCAALGLAEKILNKKDSHSLEHFTRVIQTNLVGTFNMLRLGADAMRHNEPNEQGERGIIINTSSIAAYEGQVGQAAYSASKGGIWSLTAPAARELSDFGIRVMAIAPGLFETPFYMSFPEKARQTLGQNVPFPRRLGFPNEYASLVKEIIHNTMLNGETIRLDGALRMPPK